MVDEWLKEIKENCDPESLGMILVHNGIVKGTSKNGKSIKSIKLSCDKDALDCCVQKLKKREGITMIKVWINHGILNIGDNIIYLFIAGRFRTDVLPVLRDLLSTVKSEIVHEEEYYQ
jgi:molybdopterin synthase catalytic subunit